MDNLEQFLAMGGYARFVWPAFGLSALVLIGLYVQSRHFLGRMNAELSALQADGKAAEGEDGLSVRPDAGSEIRPAP